MQELTCTDRIRSRR